MLPESSFNVGAANFVPSGVTIPDDIVITTTEKPAEKVSEKATDKTDKTTEKVKKEPVKEVVKEADKEETKEKKDPLFNFNATSFVPSTAPSSKETNANTT